MSLDILENFNPEPDAAAAIHKSVWTMQRWRRLGQGPTPTYIGETAYFSKDQLRTWLASQAEPPVRAQAVMPRRDGAVDDKLSHREQTEFRTCRNSMGVRLMIPLATIIILVALFLAELAWFWRQ